MRSGVWRESVDKNERESLSAGDVGSHLGSG